MKTRHQGRLFFIGLVLLQLLPQCLATGGDDGLVCIEGRQFDIVGTDNRSVSFVNTLSEYVAEMCQRYLKAGSFDFSGRILVTLRPEGSVDFDEDYRIRISSRGQVDLDFCWNESLSFETICRAFTEAYLLYYARFNYGVGADERIRAWSVSALVSRIYLSLRPAWKADFIRVARQSETLGIKSLLLARLSEANDGQLDPHQGYWLLQILRKSGLTRSQLTVLLERAIAGADVSSQLSELIFPASEENPESLLEEWWQNQLRNYLTQEYEFYDSLKISQSWIGQMARFEDCHAANGKLNDLMQLWTYRKDETLRSVLSARCEIIRLRIERVNPAYFNAALSLGALYETILEAENKHEFIRALVNYLNDWEDTKQLHSRTEEFISACN